MVRSRRLEPWPRVRHRRGLHPSRRPARAGLLRMRDLVRNQSRPLCQGTGRASRAAAGGRSRTRKNPVRFPARGTLREFQFREYSDLRSGVNTLFSAAGVNSSGNIFRLAPGQMPEFGMFLSPMLRILRRRSIKLSDPSKSPVRRPAYCTAFDACVPNAVQRAGYAERCSADPGPIQTPSLERSRLKAGTRVERCETNVRITTLAMTVRDGSVPLFEPCP